MTEKESASRFSGPDEHGWSPDLEGTSTAAAEAGTKARQKPSHEETASAPEDHSVGGTLSSTDLEPESPFGAGDSHGNRGEEFASGDEAEGHKGVSQRPYGGSDAADATGVYPQDPRDPASPSIPPA